MPDTTPSLPGQSDLIVDVRDLRFAWPGEPPLLDIPAFQMGRGERVFLRGPSGSGKSTLLGLIAGVLAAEAGQIKVVGQDLRTLSGPARDRLRADHLGVVFQMFNLVPYLSVEQNIALPCRFSARRAQRVTAAGGLSEAIHRLLSRLGLDEAGLSRRAVTDLSVGQQQRVAVARALIGEPNLIIADEPTSALDSDTRDRFIALLNEEVAATGAALLFVSHDGTLASHFERAIDLGTLNRARDEEGVAA